MDVPSQQVFRCRVKFRLSPDVQWNSPDDKYTFSAEGDTWEVKGLKGFSDPIYGRTIVFTGGPFTSRDTAIDAGDRAMFALHRCCIKYQCGIDLGTRSPSGGRGYPAARELLDIPPTTSIISDHLGLIVYSEPPSPKFLDAPPASLILGRSVAAIADYFSSELKSPNRRSITPKQQLAIELFEGSFFERSPIARFLLRVISIEALLQLDPRTGASAAHVEGLISATKAANIPAADCNSMLGALQWLRNESISAGGKRFIAERLGQKEYGGLPAPRFFADVYTKRSLLVHDGKSDIGELSGRAAELQRFVADLIEADLALVSAHTP